MGAKARVIPMSSQLRQALLEWKLASPHSSPGDYVFATATGTPLSKRNTYRMLAEVLAVRCGINERRPTGVKPAEWVPTRAQMDVHSLRHVFASAMIRAHQGDVEAVAALTGHKDSRTLLRVYAHEFQAVRGGETSAQRVARMDEAFGG
jgi:integrase